VKVETDAVLVVFCWSERWCWWSICERRQKGRRDVQYATSIHLHHVDH